ncbi:MAG TPA: hypothetical protein VFG69_05495 [Nannocystaceae bacterium]|nr:hypothetical protein [Nannocystaceae bacterium]
MPPVHAARLSRLAVLVGSSLLAAACDPNNQGLAPPGDELFFPSGIMLDRRAQAEGRAARWLFVANGNNDLAYNSGTVVALDLDAFYAAWTADQSTMEVDPYCGDDRCVLNVGYDTTDEHPCRRLALRPSVVECDERKFVKSSVRIGDFATLLTSSCEQSGEGRCDHSRLWLPVRGDPSVTFIDLAEYDDGDVKFSCGAPDTITLDGDQPVVSQHNAHRCAKDHRITRQRNDEDLPELDREPFQMLISPSFRYAYVAHADAQTLSIIALDGLRKPNGETTGTPALIESAGVFQDPSGLTGGFGLAERPCNPQGNAPSLTNGCTRPLVYGGFRYLQRLARFTVQGVDFADPDEAADKCLAPGEDLDTPGKLNCDPRVRSYIQILPGGLDPSSTQFRPTLGDIAFGDDDGNELYVVQTAPGALLKLDTSLGPDGEPFDTPSAPPIELCEEPTRMKIYREGGQRFAAISCFRAAELFIIDLDAFRLTNVVQLGTGPYEIEVDEDRGVLYVGNSLERSISVIDLSRERSTRFQEIARIGLQEPFMR